MASRVNNRRIPRELAGIPISRETLERIKANIAESLPPRPLEHVFSDLLCHAYMRGFRDAALAPATKEERDRFVGWLRILEPHLDAVICYASTIGEHPPNGAVLEIRDFLAAEQRKS